MNRELLKNAIRRLASSPFGTFNNGSLVLSVVCSLFKFLKKGSSSAAGSSTASMNSSVSALFLWYEVRALILSKTPKSLGKSCTRPSYKFCRESTTWTFQNPGVKLKTPSECKEFGKTYYPKLVEKLGFIIVSAERNPICSWNLSKDGYIELIQNLEKILGK